MKYTRAQREALFRGFTVTQLSELFHMKRQNVERRIAGVRPSEINDRGVPIYPIVDVAPKLVDLELTDDMIYDAMMKFNPKDFPAFSNKMFWEGMIQRRKYQKEAGELWHTDDVVAVASTAFNNLRLSLLLLPDELITEGGLNEAQSRIVQKRIDDAIEELNANLVIKLSEIHEEQSSGPGLGPVAENGAL